MASEKMLQNGKIRFFAPSSYDDDPFEPPPAYSARPDPSPSFLPPSSTAPPTEIQKALWAFQEGIREAVTQNHQDQLKHRTEEDREVRRQLLNLMGEFLSKVSNDSPKSIHELPASVHGILKADLYVAPQEAIPISSGWHLSGVSQRDDEIIGRAVQEARVWPTETQSTKQKNDVLAYESELQRKPDQAEGLWSAVDGLTLNEAVYETRGTLWWNTEREAQALAENLDMQLVSLWRSSMLHGSDHVKIKTRAEYMTFRRENEMGLWESKSGWTIVMAVTLLY